MAELVRKVRRRRFVSIHCVLLGHDDMMAREPQKLCLRCNHCGRETSGWALAGRCAAPGARSTSLFFAAARPV